MIPILLALAAPQAVSAADAARFQSCVALVKSQPQNGLASAEDWVKNGGGGFLARQCLGLAYSALERWAPAATAFEEAAREAELKQDPRSADFHVQAGNAWLAAGDGAKAREALNAALLTGRITGEMQGEVYLDRARAAVLLGDVPAARRDLDQGLKLVPKDPYAWYLSSALALRENDAARAKRDIDQALTLAPDDAGVLVQAGNVAGLSGDAEAARNYYAKAISLSPNSEAAKAAQAALAANPAAAPARPQPEQP